MQRRSPIAPNVSRLLILLMASAMGASALNAADTQTQLVSEFWQARTAEAIATASANLSAAGSTQEVYNLLRTGPTFDDNAATGFIDKLRVGSDGIEYPYAILVPPGYDASQSYPVEFMLHGGVGRPKRPAGEVLWRSGYETLAKPDRITVVPAAWSEAYWWQANQAENLREILKELKRGYNVDDNRVSMTGVSDGGTGAYFFAFKQPTEWASFLPYIGHPGVLRNAQSGGGYRLFFENLMETALYIVNGENDRLYPVSAVQPFIDILVDTEIDHTFIAIAGGGHNTQWLPDYEEAIEEFKRSHPRDPFPETIHWVTDRSDKFNRNRWIRVDSRLSGSRAPANLAVNRQANVIDVRADGVGRFTLLLSPQEIDFGENVRVIVNGEDYYDGPVEQDTATLLAGAAEDLDRQLLYTAQLTIDLER